MEFAGSASGRGCEQRAEVGRGERVGLRARGRRRPRRGAARRAACPACRRARAAVSRTSLKEAPTSASSSGSGRESAIRNGVPSPVARAAEQDAVGEVVADGGEVGGRERGDVGRDEQDRAVVAVDGSRAARRPSPAAAARRRLPATRAQASACSRSAARSASSAPGPSHARRAGSSRRGERVEDDGERRGLSRSGNAMPTGASSARATCGSAAASVAANAVGLASTRRTSSSTGAASSARRRWRSRSRSRAARTGSRPRRPAPSPAPPSG